MAEVMAGCDQPKPTDKLFTLDDVAQRIGVSWKTVRRYTQRRGESRLKTIGKGTGLRIRPVEFARWLSNEEKEA